MKIVKKNQLKNVIFAAVKNCSILHGRVFVMILSTHDKLLLSSIYTFVLNSISTLVDLRYNTANIATGKSNFSMHSKGPLV